METTRRLELHLVSEFGDRPLSTITRSDLAHAIDLVQAKGYPISANRTLANSKTFFRWCVERGPIERSPADYLRPRSIEISRDRILSNDDLRAVWGASKAEGYPSGDIARLLTLTAQRREEVAGMRWAELDLRDRKWTLDAGRTKSGCLHVVPLCSQVVEILNGIKPLGALVLPAGTILPETSFFRAGARPKSVSARPAGSATGACRICAEQRLPEWLVSVRSLTWWAGS